MEKLSRFCINPVFLKELRTVVRNRKLSVTLMVYNTILGLVGTVALYVIFYLSGSSNMSEDVVMILYLMLTLIEFFLICFAIPAYTAGSISGEREKQTLDILLTTPLKPASIALGKLMSGIGTIVLLVISSLPILALVFTIGGISIGDIALYMLFIVITAFYVGSFGVLFSAKFKKTAISTVFTYATLIFMGIGTCVVILVAKLVGQMWLENMHALGKYTQIYDADLGYGVLLLMINPGVTWASLAMNALGSRSMFSEIIGEFGTIPTWIINWWFYISSGIQIIISFFVIKLAGRRLNPLLAKNRKRKIKKKKEEVTRTEEQ
ncbi:MAG: ABC transporter permease subunit [Lachnospiraceae bacterium]|nr:ABC transporter permease subunit [Lachnospiraceae bacterium]